MASRFPAAIAFDGLTKVSSKLTQHISSLQNPRVKAALKLHSSRGRKDQNRMIIFGRREFERAAAAKIDFLEVFVREDADPEISSLVESSASAETLIASVSPEVFSKLMFGERSDFVIGIAQRPSTLISELKFSNPGFVLVLQAIEKPGNASSAAAVLLADCETDFYHPNSIRASTGAVFSLPLASGTSQEIQEWISANQLRVVTAIVEGSTELFDADLTGNIAIVLGNEARGLDHQWKKEKYQPVRLPMLGVADSLNVSVTASVMMYETVRQQQGSKRT